MEKIKFSVAMSVYKNDDAGFFDRALASITELQTVKPMRLFWLWMALLGTV